ncbi:uncharacterized protein ACIGJ3_016459 [Trichechus inunguis]
MLILNFLPSAPTTTKMTHPLHPKPKPTLHPEVPQTKLVPATDLEPVALGTEAPETMVLTTVLEPVTLRTEAPETTLASKTSEGTRRPHPTSKTTSSPEAPQTKLVAATGFEPVFHISEAPETTLASIELQTLILKPVMSPSLEMPQSQPVSDVLESITFSPESSMETIGKNALQWKVRHMCFSIPLHKSSLDVLMLCGTSDTCPSHLVCARPVDPDSLKYYTQSIVLVSAVVLRKSHNSLILFPLTLNANFSFLIF